MIYNYSNILEPMNKGNGRHNSKDGLHLCNKSAIYILNIHKKIKDFMFKNSLASVIL